MAGRGVAVPGLFLSFANMSCNSILDSYARQTGKILAAASERVRWGHRDNPLGSGIGNPKPAALYSVRFWATKAFLIL